MMLDFFISVGEMRDSVEIPAKDLDSLLSRFFLGVLKKNGDEYEPDSLSSMFNSLDRHLKDSKSSIRYDYFHVDYLISVRHVTPLS